MRQFKTVLTAFFAVCLTAGVFAQNTTKEVQVCANLDALMELKCGPNDAATINFNVDTKDKWRNGVESTDYNQFEICATCDWKLMCEVVGANGDHIDELNGNGGQLPLSCIGKKVLWQGTENWEQLLEERAEISGKLVLSDFTKNAIAAFKKK